ncbi:MAG: SDR family oxidoreductase [Melioribacteraceae bacterium]|nr:SDR family oxidoreductase [Melioribacteraceae bacterium]
MDKKVALITGASRGIGNTISIGLAQKGYQTILLARSKEQMEFVASEIGFIKNALKPEIHQIDVLDFQTVQELILNIELNHGTIDILVNNAGIYIDGSVKHKTEDYQHLLNVNLVAPYNILNAVVPIMKKQKCGYIFNIASRAGKIGLPNSGSYCSSKFGLVGLNESLYKDLADYNVKVTAICPSWVNTNMAFKAGATVPGEEMIQTKDIMETINLLLKLSPHASVKEIVIDVKSRIA